MGVSTADAFLMLKKCGLPRTDDNNVIYLDATANMVTVGRSSSATYIIHNKYLSKLHATMKFMGTAWTVEDLNSSNGTYVNEIKLVSKVPCVLSIGDEVGFGMPVSYRDREDGLVYRLFKYEERPVTDIAVEQEALIPEQAEIIPEENMGEQEEEQSVEQKEEAQREIKVQMPVIELERCDGMDFKLPNEVIWNLNNDSEFDDDSDYVIVPVRGRKRPLILSDDDDSDHDDEEESPLSPHEVKRRIKIVQSKVTPTKVVVMNDIDVIDLCTDDEEDQESDQPTKRDQHNMSNGNTKPSMDDSHAEKDSKIGIVKEIPNKPPTSNGIISNGDKLSLSVQIDLCSDDDEASPVASPERPTDDNEERSLDGLSLDFHGYSQHDEVILISDGEEEDLTVTYADRIKVEVKEEIEDDNDDDEWTQVFRQIDDKEEVEVTDPKTAANDIAVPDFIVGTDLPYEGDMVEKMVATLHGALEEIDSAVAPPELLVPRTASTPIAASDSDSDETVKDDDDEDKEESPQVPAEQNYDEFFPASQLLNDTDESETSDNDDPPENDDADYATTKNIHSSISSEQKPSSSKPVAASAAAVTKRHPPPSPPQLDRLKSPIKIGSASGIKLIAAKPIIPGRRSGITRSMPPSTMASTSTNMVLSRRAQTKPKSGGLKELVMKKFDNRVRAAGGGSDFRVRSTPLSDPRNRPHAPLPTIPAPSPGGEISPVTSNVNGTRERDEDNQSNAAGGHVPKTYKTVQRNSRSDLLLEEIVKSGSHQLPVKKSSAPPKPSTEIIKANELPRRSVGLPAQASTSKTASSVTPLSNNDPRIEVPPKKVAQNMAPSSVASTSKIPQNMDSFSMASTSKIPQIMDSFSMASTSKIPQNMDSFSVASTSKVPQNMDQSIMIPPSNASGNAATSVPSSSIKKCYTKTPGRQISFSTFNSVREIENREQLKQQQQQIRRQNQVNQQRTSKDEVIDVEVQVLLDVLKWKTTWFEEKIGNKSIAPVVNGAELTSTKLFYKSYEEYTKTYRPLMLLETFEDVAAQAQSPKKVLYFMELVNVNPYYQNGVIKATQLHFNLVIPKDLEETEDFPNEGWLTKLMIPVIPASSGSAGKREYVNMLAYIQSTHKSPYVLYRNPGIITLLDRIASQHKGETTLLSITLMTTSRPIDLKRELTFKMTLITKFRKCLQRFESVANVSSTPLGRALLDPNIKLSTLPIKDPAFKILSGGIVAFNENQTEAIMRVTKACVEEPTVPTVAMIHGPPGTGKTATIAGLIAQLIHGDHVQKETRPLILLCAPSNNAVDEDVKRLINNNTFLRERGRLRIVRLGQADQIVDSQISKIHVDCLIQKNVNIKGQQQENNKREMGKIIQEIKGLRLKMLHLERQGQIGEVGLLRKEVSTKEGHRSKIEIGISEHQKSNGKNEKEKIKNIREELLTKAHVIATTLGSCSQAGMEIFKADRKQQIICIVDEATQCVEPDLLAVLQYGITKLVLVGDPMQLPPTVLSNKASEMGYQRSLFERFYQLFKGDNLPAIKLNVQYRMHPEICRFPSRQFYNKELMTASGLNRTMDGQTRFVPYMFFDVINSREMTESHNISNPNEATFVTRLVEFLLEQKPTVKIGVITYYAQQKHMIIASFNSSSRIMSVDNNFLEVNTVDGFQGREMDVIIVSAVRARSKNGSIGFVRLVQRLNVAITRARHALYICGHVNTLKVSPVWHAMISDAAQRSRLNKVTSTINDQALQAILHVT